jgi:hypothetical protein
MFPKVVAAATLALTLSIQVNAHAVIVPMLGVAGKPVRSDAQRPSANAPCGTIDIAQTIDSSASVPAAADGSFNVNVTNFGG